MKSFFITATGTNIGKTFVTTSLCRELRGRSIQAHALKPVISGWDVNDPTTDTHQLLGSLGLPITTDMIEAVSPWRFTAPLSPDMAAKAEPKEAPTVAALSNFCQEIIASEKAKYTSYLFIEGVGGVMVPLNSHETQLEWIKNLGIPVVLVTGSYLGTLSHTLTALTTLEQAKIPVAAVIVNETPESTVGLEATAESLRHFSDAAIITLPYAGQNVEKVLEILENYPFRT
ncbi:MAG: bioD [Rickettsiales bacterium]|jgi:dethiobiotin synthetase|nr:bioD [Rickettsiales bacterium]